MDIGLQIEVQYNLRENNMANKNEKHLAVQPDYEQQERVIRSATCPV